jgi:hypothetical protein
MLCYDIVDFFKARQQVIFQIFENRKTIRRKKVGPWRLDTQ